MKEPLNEFKEVLVHIYEYIADGQKRSAVLIPIDDVDNVLLEETFEGSGIMRGRLVSGGTVHIPLEGITNYFQSWWKLWTDDGRGGVQGQYTDDTDRVGRKASEDVGKKGRWDEETGEYKRAKEVDRPPPDAKRIHHKDKRPEGYKD